MCGMCSQHCPTYQLTANESESPRGRIALIAALSTGQLALDVSTQSSTQNSVQTHLEHCTGCRACEDYCPSDVAFSAIMNEAKSLLPKTSMPAFDTSATISLSKGRWLRRYQNWGLQKIVRASGVLKPLGLAEKENLLPAISETPEWQSYYPANPDIKPRGDVGLFTGCIANVFDREALEASRRLLNRLGYGVHVPPTQGCCGAMAQHSGQSKEAVRLATKNLHAYSELNVQAIVHTASGCTAQLSEYHLLPALDDEHIDAAKSFAAKSKDISQFLAEAQWPADLQAAPLKKNIALHTPCSLKNVLHQADAPRQLLQRIPALNITPLPKTTQCCGGAGQYMLQQAEFAHQLREQVLNKLDTQQVGVQQKIDILATSNLGCALHLAAGLRERGQKISVVHPIVLLAQQMGLMTNNAPVPTTKKSAKLST